MIALQSVAIHYVAYIAVLEVDSFAERKASDILVRGYQEMSGIVDKLSIVMLFICYFI